MQAQPLSFSPDLQAHSLLVTLLNDVNQKKNLILERSIPQEDLKKLFSNLLENSRAALKSCNEINATVPHGTPLKDMVNKIIDIVSDHVALFNLIEDENNDNPNYQQFYSKSEDAFQSGLQTIGDNKLADYTISYSKIFQQNHEHLSAESAASAN